MTYHVDQSHEHADDRGPGTAEAPWRTVSAAAERLRPGDEVVVHAGTYRERVTPARGGKPDAPIIYRAAAGESVIISGSCELGEPVNEDGPLREYELDPRDATPFVTQAKRIDIPFVLGQLFLDGTPLPQASNLASLRRTPLSWMPAEGGRRVIVNLAGRTGRIEATIRDRLFAPRLRGLGHIHISGFVFEHCANQLPSAFWIDRETPRGGVPQAGAVSTRSGCHWRIVNCTIRHVTGIGIDFGSEGGRDIEPIESGPQPTPPIDHVGYHEIAHNHLHDIGVCGIAGYKSTGVVIAHNRIERCNTLGWSAPECGGIKVHYFIRGTIEANLLLDNDCHGIWLDNVWTNARVTRNVVLSCQQSGIFVEMGHGPCLVDRNVVGYTRAGDGIYTHDASGVTIAHNMLMCNAHFGVSMRTVTDRTAEDADGVSRQVRTSEQRILNNLFVDNYRGHIAMPPATAITNDNKSDQNLFIGGTQWHWNGASEPRFMLVDCNGRIPSDVVWRHLGEMPGTTNDYPACLLDRWRDVTGNDRLSISLEAYKGRVEDGAVEPGQVRLSTRGLYFECARAEAIARSRVRRCEQVDTDMFGSPLFDDVLPGPIALTGSRTQRYLLWPLDLHRKDES